MRLRRKLTEQESKKNARNAIRAFHETERYIESLEHPGRESVGDGGEEVGRVSGDYGVSPDDVTAERDRNAWADGSGGFHETLVELGYRKTGKSAKGHVYQDTKGGGKHVVTVAADGSHARCMTSEGEQVFESSDELRGHLPARIKASESVSAFFQRYSYRD